MSLNYKTLALARDLEQAFKNHLNVDSFPTMEWPRVALELAKTIEATGDTKLEQVGGVVMECDAAVRFVNQLSALNNAIADLVNL